MLKNDIEINGWATVSAPVRSVGDLRMLMGFLDEHGVSEEAEIDWGTGKVHVDIANLTGEFIECGEHIPPESKYDVLLVMHGHDYTERDEREAERRAQSLADWLGYIREQRDDWRGPDYAR